MKICVLYEYVMYCLYIRGHLWRISIGAHPHIRYEILQCDKYACTRKINVYKYT